MTSAPKPQGSHSPRSQRFPLGSQKPQSIATVPSAFP